MATHVTDVQLPRSDSDAWAERQVEEIEAATWALVEQEQALSFPTSTPRFSVPSFLFGWSVGVVLAVVALRLLA